MPPKKMTEISSKYVKLEQREHVLLRPGMYIGSVQEDTCDLWVVDDSSTKMEKKSIKYIAGLYKIFDEILVNAIDHGTRLRELKTTDNDVNLLKNLKVNISKETGIIEVFNDGDGVDVVKHPEHDMYIPQLIFAEFLSSTNYDDEKTERIIGGLNGYGAKACNVFSKWFEIETVDHRRKLHYIQKFENNMSVINPPTITKNTKKPYTIIKFLPDYERFGIKKLTDDMFRVLKKRIYDACAVTDKEVSIYFNENKLEFKTFEKYVDLYLGDKTEHTRVYEAINERWEVIASYNQFNGFEQVSFVNGIWTIRGGKHVDYILNQIVKKLTELIQKKKKDITIKPASIKDNLFLFVKSVIVNPSFDSQSKETLTTPVTKFGSKGEVSDKFIEKLYKSGIVEKILEISELHDNKKLQKTDGKKKLSIRGIPKLEDALWAGGPKSSECTLILTEGDSALSMVLNGLSEKGSEKFGCFPLRGKVLNVKDQSLSKIADNEEISNIKKILGLENNKEYNSVESLRYGKLMILSDQDADGVHIKGLIFNLFHSLWPTLMKKCDGFLSTLLTPLVKVQKGNVNLKFYCTTDYENWARDNNKGFGWNIRFLKGLGSSTPDDAKQYFKEFNVVDYKYTQNKSDVALDLAFNKKKADERKQWLSQYDRQRVLDYKEKNVTFEEFVDKDLIHFSNYDIERSIPNVVDGLKTSQRKILFGCFKRNLVKETKVAQLSGYVSEHAAYHHGEVSLQMAIIGMNQDFVGANNINLLKGVGVFGSRRMGGTDSASPRYIFTLLSPITNVIFPKEDNKILKYLDDDGMMVEPEYYIPTIPMALVNSVVGIGTGFSTSIPPYNPLDIVDVLEKMMRGENVDSIELVPWVRGFKGTIEKASTGKYVARGIFKKVSSTKIEITELPPGLWTINFKEHLEDFMEKNPDLKGYEHDFTSQDIKFVLQFASATVCDKYLKVESNGYSKLENDFKLVSSKGFSTTNMHLFNPACQIRRYESPIEIIKEFYQVRISCYNKRKEILLGQLKYDIEILKNKMRFIKAVVAEKIMVTKMKKDELEARLAEDKYMLHEEKYDYLLRIPIYNLTTDKVNELENEVKNAKDEIKRITDLDTKDWWKEDLDKFKAEYKAFGEHAGPREKTKKKVHMESDKVDIKAPVKAPIKAPTKLPKEISKVKKAVVHKSKVKEDADIDTDS